MSGTTAVLDKFGGLVAKAAKYFPLATTKFQFVERCTTDHLLMLSGHTLNL